MADSPNNPGLNSFLSRFGWFSGSIATVAVAAPVVVLVEGIGPETGGRAVDYLVLSALSFATAVLVYVKCSRMAKRRLMKWLCASVACSIFFVLVYTVVFSRYTELDVLGERYVKGYEYTSEVAAYKQIITQARASGEAVDEIASDRDLVINFQNDPANVWTQSSISRMKFLLHAVFALLAVPISATLAFFILSIPEQRKPKEGSSPQGAG
jgi:hypothetical protein